MRRFILPVHKIYMILLTFLISIVFGEKGTKTDKRFVEMEAFEELSEFGTHSPVYGTMPMPEYGTRRVILPPDSNTFQIHPDSFKLDMIDTTDLKTIDSIPSIDSLDLLKKDSEDYLDKVGEEWMREQMEEISIGSDK